MQQKTMRTVCRLDHQRSRILRLISILMRPGQPVVRTLSNGEIPMMPDCLRQIMERLKLSSSRFPVWEHQQRKHVRVTSHSITS